MADKEWGNQPPEYTPPIDDTLPDDWGKIDGGGGGGGSDNYNDLSNKPKINNVTLEGNRTLAQLGVAAASSITRIDSELSTVKADVADANTKATNAATNAATALQSANEAKSDVASLATTAATKTEVNALASRVTQNESDISDLTTTVDSKATKTEVQTVASDLADVKSTIGDIADLNPASDTLVEAINKAYNHGGGGGGGSGTSDYNELDNKPKINDVVVTGNKDLDAYGIASKSSVTNLKTDVEANTDNITDHETRIKALEDADVVNPIQFEVMPTASAEYNVVQYVGADTANFNRGYFYRSTPSVVSGSVVYDWQQIDTQPSNLDYSDLTNKPTINTVELSGNKTAAQLGLQTTIQYSTMPTADATNLGQIVQYIGATTTEYTQGYFYQSTYDSENASYKWVYKAASHDDSARVTALENAVGDISQLSASTLVEAISALSRHDIKTFTYTEPNLIITYNDDTTATLNLLSILNETQIGELANVLDSTIEDTNVLQYDAALQAYKPYAVVKAIADTLQAAKDYTDTAVKESVVAGAFVCDEKPEYDAENDTVIYKQDGVTKTTTQTDARFYYHDSEDQSFCTSWINDIEFTFSVAAIEFSDYVKVEDLVDTYTGEEVDKTKIPTLAALDALVSLIRTNYLANYVLKDSIEDSLTSKDREKVLSAKQGYLLNEAVSLKQDITQVSALPTADSAHLNMVLQTVPNGKWWRCEYDSENDEYKWAEIKYAPTMDTALDADSTNPVTNKAITQAFGTLQTKALSTEIAEASTVETALASLETLHNANATTIENHTETLSELQIQLNKDHAVNVTLYDTEAAKPTAIDFENGVVTSVGASAYVLATKKWYRCTAIDTITLEITWTEFDGLGSKLVAGNGISIDESTGAISSDVVEFHGTHDEWDSLSASEQAKYNARDFTDDVDDDATLKEEVAALTSSVEGIEAVIPYKIDRVRYNLANTDFPSGLAGSDIVTWLNARETDSVFRKQGIYIVELYNTSTNNYGYFFIQNLGTQGADTTAGYGVAEFKTYYTAGGRPYYFLLKRGTWSLMHDAHNMYLETSSLTSTVSSGSTAPIEAGAFYPTIGSVTCDSSLFASGSRINYTVSGKVVVLYINDITTIAAVNGNIASGLPKPITATYGVFIDSDGKPYTVTVNTSTAVTSTIPSGKTLKGQIVYMAA